MTPARTIFLDPDFRRMAAINPCCVCGRRVRGSLKVRLINGGMYAVWPGDITLNFGVGAAVSFADGKVGVVEEDNGEDFIGPDCAKALGSVAGRGWTL